MAVDVTLLPATNTNNINTNFQRIKEALTEALGRAGDLPNHMNADLDMNSNDILNVKDISTDRIILNGKVVNPSGDQGWGPVFGAVEYNGTIVMRLVDYVGGTGTKPTQYIGWYVGETGYTLNIGEAINFGSTGVIDGDRGDIVVSNNGGTWNLSDDIKDNIDDKIPVRGGTFFRADQGGQLDLGTTVAVMAHTGPDNAIGSGLWTSRDSATNPKPGVLGLSPDSQIATYKGIDTVALYVDIAGPPLVASLPGSFTSTTWVPSSTLSNDVLERMYVGQYIRTATSGHWGKITEFTNNLVTVSGWFENDNTAPGQVPAGVQNVNIGVVTGIWGLNGNVLLGPDSFANSGLFGEIGVVNYKEDYNVLNGTGSGLSGINVVSIGDKDAHFAFLVNSQNSGAGTFGRGYVASDVNFSAFEVTGWSGFSQPPIYGFLYNQGGAGNAFTVGTGGNITFNVNAQGAMFTASNVGFGENPLNDNRLLLKGYGNTGLTNLIIGFDLAGDTSFVLRDNGIISPRGYTVAQLNSMTSQTAGSIAFAIDGRRGGQGAGDGSGCWAWWDASASAWIAFDTGQALAS